MNREPQKLVQACLMQTHRARRSRSGRTGKLTCWDRTGTKTRVSVEAPIRPTLGRLFAPPPVDSERYPARLGTPPERGGYFGEEAMRALFADASPGQANRLLGRYLAGDGPERGDHRCREIQQFRRRNAQGLGQCKNHGQRGIGDAGFDAAEVRAKQPAALSQVFLGDAQFGAQLAHADTESALGGSVHNPQCACCTLFHTHTNSHITTSFRCAWMSAVICMSPSGTAPAPREWRPAAAASNRVKRLFREDQR